MDPDQCNTAGWTALHEAVERGNLELVALLLQHDADVNMKDMYGVAPLHVAITSEASRAIAIILLLLRHNADPNIQDWVSVCLLPCRGLR